MSLDILFYNKSRSLADVIHRTAARLGVRCQSLGGGPDHFVVLAESPMTRRRDLILSIVTAGCWIILLAIVLNSVFAASRLDKQARSKDRQSARGSLMILETTANPTPRSRAGN